MFSRLLALFVIVPALELYLLIRLGQLIGAMETFGIILLTGLVGSYLTKSQGLSVWRRFQTKLQSGSMPGQEIVDGVIILISGALLITPGVITDVIGLLGLVPLTRSFVRKYVYGKFLPTLSIRSVSFGARGASYDATNAAGERQRGRYADPGSGQDGPNNGFTITGDTGARDTARKEPDVEIGGAPRRRPSS